MLTVSSRRKEQEDHEESIYSLIPKTPENKAIAQRYKSIFNARVKKDQNFIKKEYKTMGPMSICLDNPRNFLKKSTKLPQLTKDSLFKNEDEEQKKPPVPKHNENNILVSKPNKDFVNRNAVGNILSIPKKPASKFVDTKGGATHTLELSGLIPVYLKKKDYGKLPNYLTQRKEELSDLQSEYDYFLQESINHGTIKCVSATERKNIIAGLKLNWEEIHHQYQGLSVVTDTAPKKNRKERMEAEMNQLEKDIELLENHSKIYVSNSAF